MQQQQLQPGTAGHGSSLPPLRTPQKNQVAPITAEQESRLLGPPPLDPPAGSGASATASAYGRTTLAPLDVHCSSTTRSPVPPDAPPHGMTRGAAALPPGSPAGTPAPHSVGQHQHSSLSNGHAPGAVVVDAGPTASANLYGQGELDTVDRQDFEVRGALTYVVFGVGCCRTFFWIPVLHNT